MTEKEQDFVQNLAIESEKIYKIDNLMLHMSNNIEYSDIVAWNGEINSVSSMKIPSKSISQKPSRWLSRRKSDTDNASCDIIEDSKVKSSFLQRKSRAASREKKLPSIVPRVLIPKLHYVQVPMQRSSHCVIATGVFYNQCLSESPRKLPEYDFSQKNITKKSMYPFDLLKKQELLYDYSPIKPVNKTIEISMDSYNSKIRSKVFNKAPSSME